MILRKTFIELLAAELQGGDTPMDTRGKYDPQTLQWLAALVFSDIVNNDPNTASDIAIEYALSYVDTNDVYTIALPKPVIGINGIFAITFGNQSFYAVSLQEYEQLKNGPTPLAKLSGSTKTSMILSQKPKQEEGTIAMIANFPSLSATDPVMLEGKESLFFKATFDLCRRDRIIQEKLNNSRIDSAAASQ